MKKSVFGLLVVLVLGSTWAQAADLKIGVVNVPKILEESPPAIAARDALQREFEPRERELLATQASLRKLEERLNRDGSIMSEAERSKLEREVLTKQRDFKHDQDGFREDLAMKRRELVENLQRQLVDSIRAYAEEKKFDLLLAEGVVYVKDSYDVTDEVLRYLSGKKK
ncbi:MAG: OmpH family outer membrane protein [Gammaproteobacteria bacterium]|nr:OmpH family outer membrane protein [Gammaproteobacteria bacterium]